MYLSKLAALENHSLLLYEPQNENFNFGTTKTLILHTRLIFFRGGHITKIWSKKIFFMKTLSKLGALTVLSFQSFILAYKEEGEETYENLPPPLPSSQPPSYLPPPPPELLLDSLSYDLDRTDLDPRAGGPSAQGKLSGRTQ